VIKQALLLLVALAVVGCGSGGGPSDSAQQKMNEEFSAEKVAAEYEKAGKHEEAAEVRRSIQKSDQ
jgi:hypothetical protein